MIVKPNSTVQHVIQIKKWDNDKCQCEYKKYCTCKNDYSWNPSTFICEYSKYLKSIAYYSVIVCDEITSVTNSVSTNVTNTVLINFDNKILSKS